MPWRLDERPGEAGGDGDIGATSVVKHVERVGDDLVERDIAVHAGDGDQVELRRGGCEQEGESVIDACVDIENDVGGGGWQGAAPRMGGEVGMVARGEDEVATGGTGGLGCRRSPEVTR